MQKKSVFSLLVGLLLATALFAAKSAPATTPEKKSQVTVKPMIACETFPFTPTCRTTPGSITVCGSSGFWETFFAYMGAAIENEAAACPPEDPGPFGHMMW
jgi:hypothetical protein